MKRTARRIVSILLVICMCMAMLPQLLPAAQAVTPDYTVSSAYQASSYYSALLEVELTGNQRDDIINVALSQVGYTEGSYSGDTGGADDGSYSNYTEYNYWYNNYINSGMPVGGSSAPWCATFVSWCARRADIPTSILNNSTAAGHTSYYFDVNFYAGSSTLASSSDNDSYFMGYNYTPKKGDLFFTRSWSHVGLVISSDGTYVTTVEGNTNDGGSAEGCGVFVRTRLVDDLYFGVPEYEEDYASSCTFYPAHCQIAIDSATPINSQPCSVSTEYNSTNLGTATVGQTYTATGLYLNAYGNYWYRVETSYGETSYLYAGDTTYIDDITSDITLTDYAAPNGHVKGSTFSVTGTISSDYNRLDTAACYIYSGFDHSGDAVTGYSASVNGYQYVLNNSTVDYNTAFGTLDSGNHTYEISTTYTNYYATSNTTISSNTGTIQLLNAYFVVVSSAVDQSSCSHSYTTTTIGAALCTEGGTQIKACSTCGLVTETAISAGGHAYGSWTTVSAATCTTDGSKTRTCSACGEVETQTIAATGHKYTYTVTAATCQTYAKYTFTCSGCGANTSYTADQMTGQWIDLPLASVDTSLFNTLTQYRYSDYQTTTSTSSTLAGYTQIGSQWIQSGTGSIQYVPSWPSGFSTSSSLYSTYNKAANKVTASETAAEKTVVDSDTQCGYLYYHWCYADSYYSQASSSGSYTTFHAYYDTTNPSSYTCDTSDMSYKTSHATCSNSNWWFVTDVYQQDYTTYQKQYTYERWTDFSDWSATAVTASDTRKVETRTVFQLKSASLATHNYVNGVCSVCGDADSGNVSTSTEYYLFGYINGANYACEEDYTNLGSYKFVDGKLTTTFNQTSYVAVKTGDNVNWYMTNGWQGEVTSVTLFDTSITGASSDKLYVPGNVEVTFTLVENNDGTLTLSYATSTCNHASHGTDGLCTSCGEAVAHTYVNSICSVCGLALTTPTLTPNYPTVSFEGAIQLNIYFTATDLGSIGLEDMGLLIFSSAQVNGTVDTATSVVSGATQSGDKYIVHTNGIAAKNLGDTLYLKVYARMADGTYVYSKMISTSPKAYALSIIKNTSNNDYIRSLCVSMLNYGAAAQQYFGYKSYDLMNATLTTDQLALVSDYDGSMMDDVVAVTGIKGGAFVKNTTAFTSMYPTVSFEGAFSINYYFVNGLTVDDNMTMYYWTADTYNSTSQLTRSNADGTIVMTDEGTRYWGIVDNIAAKDMDSTLYVAGVYTSGGTTYTTGIIAYSLGRYCETIAGNSSNDAQDLAAKTAVYGYYAECYFDWLYG